MMRLWHKDLIPVLPRQQLLSQWRECCCIARNIAVNGTPNHILVNKVLDYAIIHFVYYIDLVLAEMQKRNYQVSLKSYTNLRDNLKKGEKYYSSHGYTPAFTKDIFRDWHDNRYLTQCYYNLQEKYDCGNISEEEWLKVVKYLNEII